MTNNIPVSHTTSKHCCTIEDDNDNRRNSCCSHCDSFNSPLLNPLELQTFSLTPPLDNVYFQPNQDQPFTCIYLINLFLAPDATRYLKETTMSDDIFNLPLHIQKLVSEARMEAVMTTPQNDNRALKKLEKVRAYIHSVADHDTSAIISTLNELIQDEDELSTIVGE